MTTSVRDKLEHTGVMPEFDIATLHEMMALLAGGNSHTGMAA